MDWHRTPKDDAWKEAHLDMLVKLDMGLMLRCERCNHKIIVDPRLFAARHNRDLLTPMLTVSRMLRCTRNAESKKDGRCRRPRTESRTKVECGALPGKPLVVRHIGMA